MNLGRARYTDAEADARVAVGVAGHDVLVQGYSDGYILIFISAYQSVGQGTWEWAIEPNAILNGLFWNTMARANGDNLTYNIYLAKGTYTIGLFGNTSNGEGIITLSIDGADVADFDRYSAANVRNVLQVDAGNVVAAGGLKTLNVRVNDKNPASADFFVRIQAIIFWRTA